jgi:hypothetical protein
MAAKKGTLGKEENYITSKKPTAHPTKRPSVSEGI